MKMQKRKLFYQALCSILSVSLLSQISCAVKTQKSESQLTTATLILSRAGNSTNFIEHSEAKPFQSWLGMNLEYQPFEKLRKELQSYLTTELTNRGEAHITVISPIEFDQVLSKKISIQRINEIANQLNIQESDLTAICLGKGNKELNQKIESTYFVVVKSENLLRIRKKIQTEFESLGGKKDAFNAELYHPHVTLGFTKRDLHFEDGVVKNEASCVAKISPQN